MRTTDIQAPAEKFLFLHTCCDLGMHRFKAENDLSKGGLFRFFISTTANRNKKDVGLYILAMKEYIFIPAGYYSYIERVWLFFIAAGSFC